MAAVAAIEVDGLIKRFGDLVAVDDLSFRVEAGEIVGLLGPNGAGKTTTVNVLSTLLVPDAGMVRVAGHDVTTAAHLVRAEISLTGQFAAVDEALTGKENLQLFGRLRGLSKRSAATRAVELLATFELAEFADKAVSTYSGGMRRRLDLAASLVTQPSILFLDEPTTGLDPSSRAALWTIVRRLQHGGVTIVLTTQYLEEADQLAGRIVVIDKGRCIAEGTPASLKRRVGEATCVITLTDDSRVGDAETALRRVVADRDIAVNAELAVITLRAADGMTTLAQVIDALKQCDIEVHDVGLRQPTLEEAYLSLTGQGVT